MMMAYVSKTSSSSFCKKNDFFERDNFTYLQAVSVDQMLFIINVIHKQKVRPWQTILPNLAKRSTTSLQVQHSAAPGIEHHIIGIAGHSKSIAVAWKNNSLPALGCWEDPNPRTLGSPPCGCSTVEHSCHNSGKDSWVSFAQHPELRTRLCSTHFLLQPE